MYENQVVYIYVRLVPHLICLGNFQAIKNGASAVIAVGGDGTLNEVF